VAAIRALDKEILRERRRKNAVTGPGRTRENLEGELLERRAGLVERLRGRDPELADVFSVHAAELDGVKKGLLPGEVMAYFLPAEEGEAVRILLILREQVSLKVLAVSAEGLRRRLADFQRARDGQRAADEERSVTLVARKTEEQGGASPERTVLTALAKELALDRWGAEGAAYVVPSGDAYFIPWGALDTGFPLAVLPTGGWIGRSFPAGKGEMRASVLGDPDFGGRLPQLPGARTEALTVAGQYGVEPLIGREASEEALRRSVGRGVDVLHLATHALYDPYVPLHSALILTDGGKAVPLTAERLFERPLPAHLVILSACETGMGRVLAGDDILGLARSFYLGGAKTILSSLWPVDDAATQRFMEIFHARSKEGDFGGAWIAARNALRKDGHAPSVYGAFILGGSLGLKP
jgi:hypothetical protein